MQLMQTGCAVHSKGEVKTPLNVEEFKTKRPKVYATLMNEISFQRKKH